MNAADRNRTGTGITTHGILSPGRLPVPPLRHVIYHTRLLFPSPEFGGMFRRDVSIFTNIEFSNPLNLQGFLPTMTHPRSGF